MLQYLFSVVTRSSGRLHSELTIDFAELAEWSQSSVFFLDEAGALNAGLGIPNVSFSSLPLSPSTSSLPPLSLRARCSLARLAGRKAGCVRRHHLFCTRSLHILHRRPRLRWRTEARQICWHNCRARHVRCSSTCRRGSCSNASARFRADFGARCHWSGGLHGASVSLIVALSTMVLRQPDSSGPIPISRRLVGLPG